MRLLPVVQIAEAAVPALSVAVGVGVGDGAADAGIPPLVQSGPTRTTIGDARLLSCVNDVMFVDAPSTEASAALLDLNLISET